MVTADVDAYTVSAGVPARAFRLRLTPEQARRLAAIDWPAWEPERLRAHLADFRDVDAFIARHG